MRYAAWTHAARAPAAGPARAASLLAAALAALLLLLAPTARASDRIGVGHAQLALGADTAEAGVLLDADFEFELPAALDEAVRRGIALYFVVEFEIYRSRWYWFDRLVAQRALTYRLTYSALTRQFRLARGTLALPFDTLDEALLTMRRVRGWPVLERGVLRPEDRYLARVRMRLDSGQLPRPFQINALTDRDWALSSDWHALAVGAELVR